MEFHEVKQSIIERLEFAQRKFNAEKVKRNTHDATACDADYHYYRGTVRALTELCRHLEKVASREGEKIVDSSDGARGWGSDKIGVVKSCKTCKHLHLLNNRCLNCSPDPENNYRNWETNG